MKSNLHPRITEVRTLKYNVPSESSVFPSSAKVSSFSCGFPLFSVFFFLFFFFFAAFVFVSSDVDGVVASG